MNSTVLPDRTYQKSRVVTYVRNINILLFLLVFISAIVMAAVMAIGITDRASKNLARLYAVEAVGKFNLQMNQNLHLVTSISRSKIVTAWFGDEQNQAKRAAAYDEIKTFTSMRENVHLYFGFHDSSHKYSYDIDVSPDDFYFEGVIDSQDIDKCWYFDCIDAEYEYTVCIDRTYKTPYLMINHKVFDQNKLVGIFSAGILYEAMFNELFGQYNANSLKGYIIDRYGVIQMDSTHFDPDFDYEQETNSNILTISSDAGFNAEVKTYLDSIHHYFDPDIQPKIIKLAKDFYGYAAIIPITGTDWSTIIFYNNNSLYGIRNLLPLLIAMLSTFLIYMLVNVLLMHRIILAPINNLAASLTIAKLNASDIYGLDRDDEIGDLAQTIRKMWDHLSIDNANLLRAAREQERLIRIDQLTNIPNRRSFDERLPLEWGRAIRTKSSISLLILDLDHFKNYNDTYGHIQGDRALQVVAKIFTQELKRPGDFAARWGGEEFVVLLANTESGGALDVAERIRQNVENIDILLIDGSVSKMTVSIGVNTQIPVVNDSVDDFIRIADTALYTAKREGRNRVCLARGKK